MKFVSIFSKTHRINSSTCFGITNTNKSQKQVKSRNKCFVAISVGMQGINKTQEKLVQPNYLRHINTIMIYDKGPRYHMP